MIQDILRRSVRTIFLTDNVEREIYWILVIFRYLLLLLLILMGTLGVSFAIQDILHLYALMRYGIHNSNNATSSPGTLNIGHRSDFNASTIIKSLIIGIVVFIVPRMLWSWWIYGVPFQQQMIQNQQQPGQVDDSNRAGDNTHNQSQSPQSDLNQYLPQSKLFVPQSIDSLTHTRQKYVRLINEVGHWAQQHLKLRNQDSQKIIKPFLNRTESVFRQIDFINKEAVNRDTPLTVLVVGRRKCGKSQMIKALASDNNLQSQVAFVGVKGCVITQSKVALQGGTLVNFYELSLDYGASVEQFDSNNSVVNDSVSIQTFVQFVKTLKFVPDLILHVMDSKQSGSNVGVEMEIVQYMYWVQQQQFYAQFTTLIPLICVLSKVDDLYPADLKKPSDYDSIKKQNIAECEQVCKQFKVIQKDSLHPWKRISLKYAHVVPITGLFYADWRRDYRYNIDKLSILFQQKQFGKVAIKQLDNHIVFATHITDLLKQVSQTMAMQNADFMNKYQLLLFLVSLISLELASNQSLITKEDGAHTDIKFNVDDPISIANAVKDFWLNLGVKNLTYHGLKTTAAELINEIPMGHVINQVLTNVSGVQLGLSDLIERLGHASIAYFIERTSHQLVSDTFAGRSSY
ncbi:hypothetical protein MIR68_001141 [Amoeboaphelidium protococcarum]|nr:hypothetical protein MIR68_001141 [Amoeboaphelidium protococcarum]